MKICYLSHVTNYHTKKWCEYFAAKGHDVHVISFEPGKIEGVTVHVIDIKIDRGGSDLHKLRYMMTGRKIKKIVEDINPDIVHAHVATSYGVACALSGIKTYFLSVWGYDVYEFPKKSVFHKLLLKYSLYKASFILSTSNAMSKQTHQFTKKKIDVTPFGVNTDIFRQYEEKKKNENKFVIGVIKLLSYKYGIHILIKAFKIFIDKNPLLNCELRIAGNGPDEDKLKNLANELGIGEKVVWLGFINQKEVVKELNKFNVAVIPSYTESFGVSAVEAQACEIPLIVTNVGGLVEATKPNVTSIVVPPDNPEAIAEALIKLQKDKELCKTMGRNGREYVIENFDLFKNFQVIENMYIEYLQQY